MYPVIVVLAYKRPLALKRLLGSLALADYPLMPKLIISLEGEASPEVVDIATKFTSEKLEVVVTQKSTQTGLRNHVISCGDLSLIYGSVIVLEDDLIVDRFFYFYAMNALEYYAQDESVAGIALYAHEYNELSALSFRPLNNGYSTYPMQVVCSWGQCWTKLQWELFISWYAGKKATDLENIEGLPDSIKEWPESSWKKYFYGYIIETAKYFIFPYSSYSTNCSDAGGAHTIGKTSLNQVCMSSNMREKPHFCFCPTGNNEVVYDAYMEPAGDFIYRTLDMSHEEVTVDIQGIKPVSYLKKWKYVVTPRHAKVWLAAYRYDYRPPELNLLFPIFDHDNADLWLVSSSEIDDSKAATAPIDLVKFSYYAGMILERKELYIGVLRCLLRQSLKIIFNIKQ